MLTKNKKLVTKDRIFLLKNLVPKCHNIISVCDLHGRGLICHTLNSPRSKISGLATDVYTSNYQARVWKRCHEPSWYRIEDV